MKKLHFLLPLILLIFSIFSQPTSTAYGDDKPIEISTPEGLINIAYNPLGSYILTADIDMTDIDWLPFYFAGKLDGNGYNILNLTVNSINYNTVVTYDGNHKTYDTNLSGLFSHIDNATITNLNLVNMRMNIQTDTNCFIGGIAGYSSNSTISKCNISGEFSLTVDADMFGVAGIVGYGNGSISNTNADVTLICIDTNKEERDEQFLGGAVAAGYMDIDHCKINIDGYVSDHGYVHNGGLMGMYIFYPKNLKYYGSITYNRIEGKITFFENNTSRRAYCKPVIGEILIYEFEYGGNSEKFKSDERFTYDTVLLPHYCTTPTYKKSVVDATENSLGYTEYTCEECGYTYTDKYTSLNVYIEPPTEPETPTTELPTETTTTSDILTEDGKDTNNNNLIITVVTISAILLAGGVVVYRKFTK